MASPVARLVRRVAVIAALALLPAAAALMPPPALAQAGADYPLTDALVTGFAESYPGLVELANTLGDRYGVDRGDSDDPMSAFGAFMQSRDAMGELDAFVGDYGFNGFMEWIQVASAVALAYAYGEGAGANAQMQQAIEEIRNNPNVPAAQKEMLIQQMQAAAGVVAANQPPQANIDIVNAHRGALTAVFGN